MIEENPEKRAALVADLKELNERRAVEVRERLIYVAVSFAPARGTYKYLEGRTGVPATSWKNVILRRQMPTLPMLVGLMEYRGEYTKWLVTGEGFSPTEESWEIFLRQQGMWEESKSGTSQG